LEFGCTPRVTISAVDFLVSLSIFEKTRIGSSSNICIHACDDRIHCLLSRSEKFDIINPEAAAHHSGQPIFSNSHRQLFPALISAPFQCDQITLALTLAHCGSLVEPTSPCTPSRAHAFSDSASTNRDDEQPHSVTTDSSQVQEGQAVATILVDVLDAAGPSSRPTARDKTTFCTGHAHHKQYQIFCRRCILTSATLCAANLSRVPSRTCGSQTSDLGQPFLLAV
jgi:hypothetical protein